jgi:hypothetical protein
MVPAVLQEITAIMVTGNNGNNGNNGTSGSSGSSGNNGNNGNNGTSGSSGNNGNNGNNGTSGSSGSSGLLSLSGTTNNGIITLNSSAPNATVEAGFTISGAYLNTAAVGNYITFYGDSNARHSISSRDYTGAAADDLRINTYGSLYINLDSNNNNTSNADLGIGSHGNTATISNWLLWMNGENGNVGLGTTVPGARLHINDSNDQKIILSGSTSPYIRFQESTTNRAYIQWHPSYDSLLFRNEQTDNFDFLTHTTTGAINLRLKGSDHDIWGSFYAQEGTSAAHEVGILDGDQSWALKHVKDTSWEFLINNSSKMFINADGEVGINTTSPDADLSIYGTQNLSGTIKTRNGYNSNAIGWWLNLSLNSNKIILYPPDGSGSDMTLLEKRDGKEGVYYGISPITYVQNYSLTSNGSVSLDGAYGQCVDVDISSGISITGFGVGSSLNSQMFSNGGAQTIILILRYNGSASVTWNVTDNLYTSTSVGIKWSGGVTPTLTASSGKADVFAITQLNYFTFIGSVVAQNISYT